VIDSVVGSECWRPPHTSGTHKANFLCFSGQGSSHRQRKKDDDISERHSDHRRSKLTSIGLFTALTTEKVYSNYSTNFIFSGNKISVK